MLLNILIEKITGAPYENYIQKNIVTKLSMDNTGFYKPGIPVINHALGYSKIKSDHMSQANVSSTFRTGTSAFYSTAEDLYKLDRALYGENLLKHAMIQKMYTAYSYAGISTYNYGYGWYVFELFGKNVYGHDSHYPGQPGRMIRFIDDNLFISVLSNFEKTPIVLIPRDLAAIVFGLEYEMPHARAAVRIPESILSKYTGTFRMENRVAIISYKDNSLYMQMNNRDAIKISPETERKFFVEGSDTYYSFSNFSKGVPAQFIMHWGGHEIIMTRKNS